MIEAAGEDEKELAAEMTAAFLREALPEDKFGAPKAGPGMWASQISLFNPISVRICILPCSVVDYLLI